MSAEIIPFPARRPSGVAAAPGAPPQAPPLPRPGRIDTAAAAANLDRLRLALEALDAANATQRKAVASWRGALADLRLAVQDLGSKLNRSQDQLTRLRQGIDLLAERNLRLHHWATTPESHDQAS